MPLVANVRKATTVPQVPNTSKSIRKKPGQHLREELWITINGLWLLIVTNSQDLPVGGEVLESNSLESSSTHSGILPSSQAMNHKGASTCLCTLFSLIIMHSS